MEAAQIGRLTVRLERRHLEWLKAEADRRGRFATLSDVIRDLIDNAGGRKA